MICSREKDMVGGDMWRDRGKWWRGGKLCGGYMDLHVFELLDGEKNQFFIIFA
jgi:hypothetical protein